MRQNIKYASMKLAVISASILTITSCTDHWNQFRGPDQNMVATGKNLPAEWGNETNVYWTYAIEGEGWSSPVVWGDKVFITADIPEKIKTGPEEGAVTPQAPPPPPAGQAGAVGERQAPPSPLPRPPEDDQGFLKEIYRWEVICIDLNSGEEIWKKVAYKGAPRVKKNPATTYASESPVTDGKRLYAYFGMTGLFCYDLKGNLLWEKDLGAFPTQNGWGSGSSPIVYKNVLYVQVDNEEHSFLVAMDAETGEELWKLDRDEKTSYSTPYIWKNHVRTELVTGGKTARSYDPETGELYWELYMAGRYSIPSPVADGDHLYIGNAGFREIPSTMFAVKAGAEGNITPEEGETTSSGVTWSYQDAPTGNPSPLLYNGLLYILSSRGGEISCLDASTGEIIYRENVEKVGACWASPWAYQDRIYFYDEKGVTSVLKAGREFELLSQNSLDDKFWASMAATGNAYIFRGVERLYCIRE